MMNIAAEMTKAEKANIEIMVEQINALNAIYRKLLAKIPNLYKKIILSAKTEDFKGNSIAFEVEGNRWYIERKNDHFLCRGMKFPFSIEDQIFLDGNPFNLSEMEEVKRLKATKEKAIRRNANLRREISLLEKAIA